MNFTEFRLKVRHFIRKYSRLIFIIFVIWATIFFINLMLKNRKDIPKPTTTYNVHTSVIDSNASTPKSMQHPIEEMIEEYIGYCNEGNYQKAFNMLSEDCRKYEFNDNVSNFMEHVLVKMPTPKKYSIQDYSNVKYGDKKLYVYEIKYIDDLLATGLTNSTYAYTSEKLTFYDGEDGLEMGAGNFVYYEDVKNISENEYLKIDVTHKIVNYSIETYEIKFTNRSNYTVVVSDGQEANECILTLPNENRNPSDIVNIVLAPNEEKTVQMVFPKFVDDGDISQSLVFSSIRVMEKYSGVGEEVPVETIQSEIDNAISKFSMEVKIS